MARGKPVVCTIESSPLAIDRSLLRLVVTDQGPGISHASNEALFEPFVQGGEVAQGGARLGAGNRAAICSALGWFDYASRFVERRQPI